MKPSDFNVYPWDSIVRKGEAEIVAQNIIVIQRTGDKWRELSWEEYKIEREKDGSFSGAEKKYFDKVIDYCKSAETAALFSPEWKKIIKGEET